MSLFREAPNARRNAPEIALLALLIAGLLLAYLAPSAESYLGARREAVGLGCELGATPEEARAKLGDWLLKAAARAPAGAQPCSITASPPVEWSAVPTLGVALLSALLVGAAVSLLRADRWSLWPRGKLFGGRALVGLVALAGGTIGLAALLRHRLHAAHSDISKQFESYGKACTHLRADLPKVALALVRAREVYCESHSKDQVCHRGADIVSLTEKLHEKCKDADARREPLCDIHLIHSGNLDRIVATLSFESCAEATRKLPLPTLAAYAEKVGLGLASAEAAPENAPSAPATAAESPGPSSAGNSSAPAATLAGVGPLPDPGAPTSTQNLPPETRTVVETIETEIRRTYPKLTPKEVDSVLKYMVMGMPLQLAFALHLLGGRGEDVEETRQQIVTEVSGQLARGQSPHIDPAAADDIADRSKRDPSLRPVLETLPSTGGVLRQRATLSCATKLGDPPRDLCSASGSTAVTSHVSKLTGECSAPGSYDSDGVATLACCKCPEPRGAGCVAFLTKRDYSCQ